MADGDNDKTGEAAGFGARFFGGLKDLILEEGAPASSVAKSAAPQAAMALVSAATVGAMPVSSKNSPLTASLMELVLNRTTAYTALTEAMEPLVDIIPDEKTRYRAAFAVIKKSRTLDQVLQSIDMQHVAALEDEVARFASQAKARGAADVDARISQAQIIRGNVEAAEQQVIKLRQETEARVRTIEEGAARERQQVEQIESEVEEKRLAIAAVQRDFDAATAAVKEALQQAKAKIQQYLAV